MVSTGAISAEDLEVALAYRNETGIKLGQALIELRLLDEAELARALRRQGRIPCVNLTPQIVNPSIAEDLVRSRVDVIVTPCGPIIGAIRRLDRAMPVVFRSVDTETCAGEIADLDRPGGYTTGALYFSPDAVGRRLEVLKALVPGLSRVGVLHRPASEWAAHWAGADAAAAGMGLSLYRVEWRRNRLLSEAIDQAVSAGVASGAARTRSMSPVRA